ncbi:MAG: hypothetical protein FJ139_09345 [Deltaproteobacteria bacterium]|nr:hypothetical protein [Deltaproteobacteria bacterium]
MTTKNIRIFELKLGKRALILLILGVSSLIFFAFYLGVMVGMDMDAYPEKYARGIPYAMLEKAGWTLKSTETPQTTGSPPVEASRKDGEKVDLTFYDTLAKKKGETKILEKTAPESPPVAAFEKAPVAPAGDAVKEGGVRSSRENEPSANRTPTGKGSYQVQVVSYREKGKAERVSKRITGLGYTPRIEETDLRGKGRWFRVVLDGFENQEQALTAADAVSRKISGLNCVVRKKKSARE